MAVFGIPQGGELIVILLILVLGFGPYAAVGWIAYRLGLSKGRESRPGEPRIAPFEPRRENPEPPQPAKTRPSDEDEDRNV